MQRVEKFDSAELLITAAADLIIQIADEAIAARGKFTIALSGGSTPLDLYAFLATPSYRKKIDWKKTFVFWGDERCVPFDDAENNSRNAIKTLLEKVSIPEENIFPIPVDFPPVKAAEKYEQTIKDFFKNEKPQFDLILLGMGKDGHTASLFPYTQILNEKKGLVKEVCDTGITPHRISFTVPLINQANHKFFLVSGKEKSAAVDIVLNGKYEPEKYPAQFIKDAVWFINPVSG